jgi:hypothetical protein
MGQSIRDDAEDWTSRVGEASKDVDAIIADELALQSA